MKKCMFSTHRIPNLIKCLLPNKCRQSHLGPALQWPGRGFLFKGRGVGVRPAQQSEAAPDCAILPGLLPEPLTRLSSGKPLLRPCCLHVQVDGVWEGKGHCSRQSSGQTSCSQVLPELPLQEPVPLRLPPAPPPWMLPPGGCSSAGAPSSSPPAAEPPGRGNRDRPCPHQREKATGTEAATRSWGMEAGPGWHAGHITPSPQWWSAEIHATTFLLCQGHCPPDPLGQESLLGRGTGRGQLFVPSQGQHDLDH